MAIVRTRDLDAWARALADGDREEAARRLRAEISALSDMYTDLVRTAMRLDGTPGLVAFQAVDVAEKQVKEALDHLRSVRDAFNRHERGDG